MAVRLAFPKIAKLLTFCAKSSLAFDAKELTFSQSAPNNALIKMKFTTTILQALLVAQAVSLGAAKRKSYEMEGKGKGGYYVSESSSGKGKGSSSTSGKGKGGSYSAGKGYTPTTTEEPNVCDGILHALNDNTFKSVGAVVAKGDGLAGTQVLFSKNPVVIVDGDTTTPVASASGYCTVVGFFDERPSLDCQVTVDVFDAGSITHQGILDTGLGDSEIDADDIDDDQLIVTGGSNCFEGIVGTADFESLQIQELPEPYDGEETSLELTILLSFDVRVLM